MMSNDVHKWRARLQQHGPKLNIKEAEYMGTEYPNERSAEQWRTAAVFLDIQEATTRVNEALREISNERVSLARSK